MSYIQSVKCLLLDYKKDWDNKNLKDSFEREQFYELLDEMVCEARYPRNIWISQMVEKYGLDPTILPENYLTKLFDSEIIDATKTLINKYIDLQKALIDEAQREEKEEHETQSFKDWYFYTKTFVKNEILGDASNRADRKIDTGWFLKHSGGSEDRHLTLDYRLLRSNRDKTLDLDKNEDVEDIPKENPLVRSDSEDLWEGIPKGRDKTTERFRFLIRDKAAVKSAENMARKKGMGYNPDWHTLEDKELISKLNGVYYSILGWEGEDQCETIEERIALINRSVNGVPPKKRKRIENEIQMSIEDLCAKFQNLSKTNLIVYLFGKKSKRIMTRLNDFYNLINKSPSFIKDRPDFVQYITENRDIDKDEIASGRDLKKNREIINPSESGDQEKKLMKKQRDSQINDFFLECAKYLNRNQTKILNLMIHYDQHQSKVAQKLGFSKGYVSQEYKKILEKLSNNPHLNNLIKDIL